MFKQVILPILAVIAFIIIVGIFSRKSSLGLPGVGTPVPSAIPQKTLIIDGITIHVEIADTAAKRAQGLSGVSTLGEDNGMLFVFDTGDVTPTFWMKDMLIPLDMIWISHGKIAHIDKNVPKPAANTPDNQLKTYSAGTPIDYVLEVNAGFSDKNKVKVGDLVNLSGI